MKIMKHTQPADSTNTANQSESTPQSHSEGIQANKGTNPEKKLTISLRIKESVEYKTAIASLPDSPHPVEAIVEAFASMYDLSELGEATPYALGWLGCLLDEYTHRRSLKTCGMSFGLVSCWRGMSPGFRALYSQIKIIAEDARCVALEDAAYIKAIEGTPKGIYHNGEKIATEYNQHDKLHEILLAAHIPERYGKTKEPAALPVQINITLKDDAEIDIPKDITEIE